MNRILMVASVGLAAALIASIAGWQTSARQLTEQRQLTAAVTGELTDHKQQVDLVYDQLVSATHFDELVDGFELQTDVLESLAAYYRSVIKENESKQRLPLEIGNAHLRLGEIAQRKGDWALGLEHYEEAKSYLVTYAEQHRSDVKAQQQMAATFHLLSRAQWEIGEISAALHSSDRAMETQQRLMSYLTTVAPGQVHATALEAQVESLLFASMFVQRARIHCSLGDIKSSHAEIEQSSALCLRYDEQGKEHSQLVLTVQLDLLQSKRELASKLQKLGNNEEAYLLVQQLTSDRQQLLEQSPGNMRITETYLMLGLQVAKLYCNCQRTSDALAVLATGEDMLQKLSAQFPTCERFKQLMSEYQAAKRECQD